jgi:hypothetical protein
MAIDQSSENPGSGRPIAVARRPSRYRLAQVQLARRAEEEYLRVDPILAAAKSNDTRQLLEQSRLAAAEEAASVAFEKMQRPPWDREKPKMSSRRIALLLDVAHFTVLLARLDPGAPSPAMAAKIFQSFWTTIGETAGEVLSAGEVEKLLTRCAELIGSQDLSQVDDLFAGEAGAALATAMLPTPSTAPKR